MPIDVVDNNDGPPVSYPYRNLSNQTPSARTRPRLLLMRSHSLPLSSQSPLPAQDISPEQQSITIHEPGSPQWRRERLLRIGSVNRSIELPTSPGPLNESASPTAEPNETALLIPTRSKTYGSVSSYRNYRNRVLSRESGFRYNTPQSLSRSSSVGLLRRASVFKKPIDYDAAGGDSPAKDSVEKTNANGIRVWYSSFTSIDWLHDSIKDSRRRSKLRRRKSLRGRIRNLIDRSLGWIVVTIVGILSAILAFLIVRSEQWLFDLKEGKCKGSQWYKAKRFCCPQMETYNLIPITEPTCYNWETWSNIAKAHGIHAEIKHISYIFIALLLALTSCLLTINFTASTSFIGRKDFGVLSPSFFSHESLDSQPKPTPIFQPRKIMYFAAGSGIPEVKSILSGFVIHGYLGGQTLFVKATGLALSVASGLSLGKEGPLVHIASCVGNIVSRYFRKYETNEGKRREILSAASAAGVAVAFGAPVGGVLFSLEEVSYFFPAKVMLRSLFCAIVGALTLRILDPFGTGKIVLFQVRYDRDWHAFELGFFAIIGIFGGLYGAYFSKLNYWWAKNVRGKTWLGSYPVTEVLLITSLTTMLSFINPYTRMAGTELVFNLFAECHKGESHEGLCPKTPDDIQPLIAIIGIAMIIKAALTVITFGIKLPAGIFIPTLGVGACFGRIVGFCVQYLYWTKPDMWLFKSCNKDPSCIVPGIYAMIGAAAALSGVTRTTVSLAVIMCELTDTLTYVVPIMLGVLIGKTVADSLQHKGIYDLYIELSQLPYLDNKSEYRWDDLQAADIAIRDVEAIYFDEVNTVRSLFDKLQAAMRGGNGDGGFPLLQRDSQGAKVLGYVGVSELEHALAIVAENEDAECYFNPRRSHWNHPHHDDGSSIMSSGELVPNEFNFTKYIDQAPLSVPSCASLELVQQFFVKLGARYVVVQNAAGYFEGVIEKKRWLGFLRELEEKTQTQIQ